MDGYFEFDASNTRKQLQVDETRESKQKFKCQHVMASTHTAGVFSTTLNVPVIQNYTRLHLSQERPCLF